MGMQPAAGVFIKLALKWVGTLMRGPHELIDFTFSVHIYLNTNCHRYSVLPLDSGATNWRSLCEGTDLLPLRYLAHGDVGSACGHEQWPDSDSNVPMSTWMGIGMVVLGTSGRPIAACYLRLQKNVILSTVSRFTTLSLNNYR